MIHRTFRCYSFWQLNTLGTFMETKWTPIIQFVTCTPAMLRILSNVLVGRLPGACTVVHFAKRIGRPSSVPFFTLSCTTPIPFHGRCGWIVRAAPRNVPLTHLRILAFLLCLASMSGLHIVDWFDRSVLMYIIVVVVGGT